MTREEIIKGLECCTTEGYTCDGCPYDNVETISAEVAEYDCSYYLKKDALDLINTMQKQIDRQANNIRCLLKMEAAEQQRAERADNV